MADNNNNKILNVPPLRFPKFTDEWEKQKLSDFVERVTRKNKNNESKLPLTISAQYGLVDQITFFNKVIASNDISGYYLLKKGEFAYNKSYSGDYTWGAVKRLDRYEQGALSTLYICFSPLECVISDYLVHYFETKKWHREVSEIAVEGARNHGLLNIGVADYFNTKHFLPSKKEQKKIAAFLNLIEKRIALQTKIIEKYKSLIKGIGRSCIASIEDNSICKKLKDICHITTGRLDANAMAEGGKYPFYTCAEKPFTINEYAFDTEALLISGNGANLGYINYYKGRFNAYQRTYVLDAFTENIHFIKCVLEVMLPKRIAIEKSTSNTPYIVMSTLADMKIFLPSKIIQNRIANLLCNLETKLHQQTMMLYNYHQLKSYLLQQMFI